MLGMLAFFAVFIVIYGLMHALVYWHAVGLFTPPRWVKWLLRIFILVMILAVPAVNLLGGRAAWPAWITFVWMGLLFYLFLGSILIIPLRLFRLRAMAGGAFKLVVFVSIILSVWGIIGARFPVLKELTIATDRLPAGVDQVRILQISDIHLFSVEGKPRIERLAELLKGVDYDLLVATGDLIEAGIHREKWAASAAALAALKPKMGSFAIMGNHESYADRSAGGDEITARFMASAGFELLRQRAVFVGGALRLVGVDDPARASGKPEALNQAETAILEGLDRGRPIILLKHQPVVVPQSVGLFDIQLSGHTHQGQMWPFSFLVNLRYDHLAGLYDLGSDSWLYVSPGLGTWGPPMRFGARPTATIITLKAM